VLYPASAAKDIKQIDQSSANRNDNNNNTGYNKKTKILVWGLTSSCIDKIFVFTEDKIYK